MKAIRSKKSSSPLVDISPARAKELEGYRAQGEAEAEAELEEERRSQAEFVEWRPPGVAQLATERLPFVAGSAWFIRTVTYHLVGVVTGRYEHFLTLKDASWVADSGRFTQAIKEGKLSEVEPVGEAVVNLDSIVDAFPWTHPLPMEQK
jgi:hypothetical protein